MINIDITKLNAQVANFEAKNQNFFNKSRLVQIAIITLLALCFLSMISGASAKNFNSTSNVSDIQSFLNNASEADNELVLDEGDYTSLSNLNVSRSVNIKSNGQVNINGPGTGTLFNVRSSAVSIINLNISGYQTAISSNSSGLSVKGCNITTSNMSINCTGSNLTEIFLENNKIIYSGNSSSYGAIYINAPVGSKVNVTIKGNDITANGGTNSYGLRINIPTSNNTLILENNNIKATGQGVYLAATTGNNTITLTNNNFTGASYGFYLTAGTNSTNTITIANTNFSGTSGEGFYLTAGTNSTNTITLTNNDITGYTRGAYIGLALSTNALTLTNNDITGMTSHGLWVDVNTALNTINFDNNNFLANYTMQALHYSLCLNAPRSNNTITISNNNITGNPLNPSVRREIKLESGSNTTITYINNYMLNSYTDARNGNVNISYINNTFVTGRGDSINIENNTGSLNYTGNSFNITTSNNYLDIYGNGGNGKNVYFMNNTVYTNSAYALMFNNFFDLSNIIIMGNTIISENTAIRVNATGLVNMTVNYNRILGAVGLNFTAIDSGSNFDYNWWGINDISTKVIGFTTNNHYILNITNLTSLANVKAGDKINFALMVLNTTLTNIGVENLPYFVINGTFNGESYNSSRDDLFMYLFTVPADGLQTIDAEVDWQYVELAFNASKLNTSSTINVPNEVRAGKTINITGVATDENGNPLANTEITVTVDGKTYTVKTDSNGGWILSYKPIRTGNVEASVSWTGNSTHNGFTNNTNFNVLKRNIIITITVTENDDGSITTIANATYEDDGSPVVDHPVEFIFDGETVGTGITDKNGIAKLTIPANKISDGPHTITVIVRGNNQSNDGIASIEFTRTNQDNETNTNKTSNNPTTAKAAAMKKTGIPIIAIILFLVTTLGLVFGRKQN